MVTGVSSQVIDQTEDPVNSSDVNNTTSVAENDRAGAVHIQGKGTVMTYMFEVSELYFDFMPHFYVILTAVVLELHLKSNNSSVCKIHAVWISAEKTRYLN